MERVNEIRAQLGCGLNSAIFYVGGSCLVGKDQPFTANSHMNVDGTIHFDCGLMFKVNGKRGQGWKILIALKGNDTYTVYLVKRSRKAGIVCEVLDSCDDVYCDTVKTVVEDMYDNAMDKHCDGFINIT